MTLKMRIHKWFDTERMQPRFGIQVNTGIGWRHAVKGSEVALFDTPDEAADEMTRIRAALNAEAQK